VHRSVYEVIDNKQQTESFKKMEYGEQHKKGNGYTRQKMCNMVSLCKSEEFVVSIPPAFITVDDLR